MSLDDDPRIPVEFWTWRELDHLFFAKWLFVTGRISETCPYHGGHVALPIAGKPTFPIVAAPEPVGDGWSDSC